MSPDAFASLPSLFRDLTTNTASTHQTPLPTHPSPPPSPSTALETRHPAHTPPSSPPKDKYVLVLIDSTTHPFTHELNNTYSTSPPSSRDTLQDQFRDAVASYFSEQQMMKAAYEAAVKDEKCAWIFVAAWRRPGYISMLNVANEKTTVLEGSSMRKGFDQLQLGVPFTRFPHIFQEPDTHNLHPAFLPAHHPTTGPPSTKKLPGRLPTPAQAIPNHIPLNKHGERLDIATPFPSASLRHEFHRRFHSGTTQPCNWHHLAGRCRDAVACAYDHSEMTAVIFYKAKALVWQIRIVSPHRHPPCTAIKMVVSDEW
ncbi:hypothetical protein EJ07DRAFT_173827 [Lizonia empirigonia]|nr:hypothetical protein EJ07DRAFT_173827 [Lizonia empirigonia]